MGRKLLGLLLAAALLTGCGAGTGNGGPSPEEIYRTVQETAALPALVEMDEGFIRDYYGIEPEKLDGYVFALAEDPLSAETVIIMRARDPGDVESLRTAAASIGERKAAEMRSYEIPEQYQLAAASQVRAKGNYVYLVISQSAEAVEEVIRAALE